MNCVCQGQLKPIYKGDDATIRMMIMHADGSKMNFNDKTVKFILKKDKTQEDDKAVLNKVWSPSSFENKYVFECNLTDTETDIDPGLYWWGIRIEKDSYQVTEGEGRLEIKQGAFYGK